ncbi:MAG: hypothetical protein UV65_C0005G0001, partial [Parcubacteria group bacterium GW2011_GWF2_43_11]
APSFQSHELSLGGRLPSTLLHPQPVHLLGELAAELVEEVFAQQLGLERAEHARFDVQARDPERVRAGAAIAGAEASEQLARVDDEASAAFSALRQAGEEVLRSSELPESILLGDRGPFSLNRSVPIAHGLPGLIVDDAQLLDVLDDPRGPRIQPCDALAGVGVLQKPLAVPDHTADVQLVVQDADPALWVAVNRAGIPESALRAGNPFLVERLADLLRRCAGDVVPEDALDDVSFFCDDFALAGRNRAVLETPEDAVAVAQTAARLAVLDASAQPAPRLVGQLAQIHRVHRALEADVQEGDVAFG